MAVKPWEQQDGETVKAYEAFTVFKELGVNRGIQATANKLSKKRVVIEKWRKQNNWYDRVLAYDRHIDAIESKKNIALIVSSKKKQRNIADAGLALIAQGIQSHLANARSDPDYAKNLPVGQLAALFGKCVEISDHSFADPKERLSQRDESEKVAAIQVLNMIFQSQDAVRVIHDLQQTGMGGGNGEPHRNALEAGSNGDGRTLEVLPPPSAD